ncbi:hypothetical protein DPMN_167684 [Dreissena polymorpha]|uniref:Uncharacterized protein n=1 Tax=Dreissena polymorpha TaxID=45954 RepID=A0A9D4F0Q3_DREPO|nr:hypothetical protein DPMN_167684 [Dreissena polymorpha]
MLSTLKPPQSRTLVRSYAVHFKASTIMHTGQELCCPLKSPHNHAHWSGAMLSTLKPPQSCTLVRSYAVHFKAPTIMHTGKELCCPL